MAGLRGVFQAVIAGCHNFPYFKYDEKRNLLVIVPLRCGSRSVERALPEAKGVLFKQAMELNQKGVRTVGVYRHTCDRVVSGLFGPLNAKRQLIHPPADTLEKQLIYWLWMNDPHVSPVIFAYRNMRIDHKVNFENYTEEWNALGLPPIKNEHKNENRPKGWKDVLDWSLFWHIYKRDFDLDPMWEKP